MKRNTVYKLLITSLILGTLAITSFGSAEARSVAKPRVLSAHADLVNEGGPVALGVRARNASTVSATISLSRGYKATYQLTNKGGGYFAGNIGATKRCFSVRLLATGNGYSGTRTSYLCAW